MRKTHLEWNVQRYVVNHLVNLVALRWWLHSSSNFLRMAVGQVHCIVCTALIEHLNTSLLTMAYIYIWFLPRLCCESSWVCEKNRGIVPPQKSKIHLNRFSLSCSSSPFAACQNRHSYLWPPTWCTLDGLRQKPEKPIYGCSRLYILKHVLRQPLVIISQALPATRSHAPPKIPLPTPPTSSAALTCLLACWAAQEFSETWSWGSTSSSSSLRPVKHCSTRRILLPTKNCNMLPHHVHIWQIKPRKPGTNDMITLMQTAHLSHLDQTCFHCFPTWECLSVDEYQRN